MKKCPACAYPNEDSSAVCGICGGPLAGAVPEAAAPSSRRSGGLPLLLGAALLACAFLLYRRPPALPVAAGPEPRDGDFTYEGVLASLEAVKPLRFLPHADRLSLLPLLYSPDEKVSFEAARTIGAWSRSSPDPARRREFFEALAAAAVKAGPQVRRQAAVEAGLTVAFGFPSRPYSAQLRLAAEALTRDKDERLNAAGFFLASMAGFTDFSPELEKALAAAPSPYLKLHAACALSRFGSAAGYGHLYRTASLRNSEELEEAMICLSYSASPGAAAFLRAEASGRSGARSAGAAKMALTLREQLAIINH